MTDFIFISLCLLPVVGVNTNNKSLIIININFRKINFKFLNSLAANRCPVAYQFFQVIKICKLFQTFIGAGYS